MFADFCETRFAIATSNGTVALHLAFVSLGLKEGDEVIVPDLTFISTANAVRHFGGTPVFVDVNPDTLCIDETKLSAAITSRTKAIVPVHLYGHPAHMTAINRIAEEHGLLVIEDAAEAHGALVHNRKVGGLGHCAAFSFYGNKIVTSGEGGMITTNDPHLNEKARYLRDQAMSETQRYWHTEVAYNYRMTNLQAAIGVAQIEQIETFINRRRSIFQSYRSHLEKNPRLRLNYEAPWARNVYWMVCVQISDCSRKERDRLMDQLRESGIDSRPFFYPCSQMPMYSHASAATPVAAKASSNGINLPSFSELTGPEIEHVCTTLNRLTA